MNAIFTSIFVASAAILMFISPQKFLSCLSDGAKQSLHVAATLFCIYAVWMGISEVAENCGINKKAAKLLRPVCARVFRTKNEVACGAIAMNITCCLLGAGASTPYAIKAINELERDGNSYAQKLVFIINAAGMQIMPSTVITLRATAGSGSAADIFLPCILCCLTATASSVCLYMLCNKLMRKRMKVK